MRVEGWRLRGSLWPLGFVRICTWKRKGANEVKMKFAIAGEESKIQSRAEPVWGADSGGYGGHWVRGSGVGKQESSTVGWDLGIQCSTAVTLWYCTHPEVVPVVGHRT